MTPAPLIKYKNGLSEARTFPELDIFELYQFIDLLVAGKSPEIVQLCARQNAAWVKELDFGCYRELIAWFVRRNFPMAMEIATSDPIAGLKVGPLLVAMGNVLKLLPGATSSPTLTVGAPSGGSSSSTPPPAAAAGAISAAASATPPATSAPGSAPTPAPASSASST